MNSNVSISTLPDSSVLADEKQRAAWILYELKLRGLTLASLARQYKVARNTPRKALLHSYPAWEFRIAKALGRKPQEIFPERYDLHGIPSPPTKKVRQFKDNSSQSNRNAQRGAFL